MPIYEYKCDECATEFQDLVMSRAAELEVVCKSCNSPNVTKLLSGAAVKSGSSSSSSPASYGPPSGGCGGGCSCH